MKAYDLAEALMMHPEYEVHVELPEIIDRVKWLETDCFSEAEGPVFVLILEGDDE